ncbi:MAG TPA: glycosyl hydrolase family 65 protein [Acidimicrobiales bacterium]|nr:glycosyl hydrolase family 65 protein [Acidimicrobiales bacterium]
MTTDVTDLRLDALHRRYEGVVLVAIPGGGHADAVAELRRAGVAVATVDWHTGAEGVAEALRLEFGRLWALGIGPSNVAVVVAAGGAVDVTPLLALDQPAVLAVAGDGVPPAGAVALADSTAVAAVLADQLRRRLDADVPVAVAEPGWALRVEAFDAQRQRVHQSLLALADGRVGAGGAPLLAAPGSERWVMAAGLYTGDGPETRLVTAPAAFHLAGEDGPGERLCRLLDLRSGLLYEEAATPAGPVRSVRFLSLARPGTAVLRALSPEPLGPVPSLAPPAEDPVLDDGTDGGVAWARVVAGEGGVAAAAVQRERESAAGHVLDRVVAYATDAATVPSPAAAVGAATEAAGAGFEALLAEHRRTWAARWDEADVAVEGDPHLQEAVRFALFHLMASVPDTGEAAIGARGLSGPAYRGHVFWDADTFVLPFLAATHPAAARAMLEYRVRRLPAAMEAARAAGRAGARFPWESAATGRDVTPLSAVDRAGRLVRIRTGQLEEHIVAEVAWAACCYTDWTGDEDFAAGPGLRLLVETARYWASRIRVNGDGRAHLYGVIGPDEYHEPVDDNAFTNVMARWNLRRAAAAVETGPADAGVADVELARWRALADAIVDGYDPDTGVYEQFAGFGRLQPLIIAEMAPRRPIAADLLYGSDLVRGAQIVKQADALMLHHLVPGEVVPGSLDANLRYYEPRTAHGSSLSPSIFAALFARARDYERSLEALDIAGRIDLDDLTETTAGGLHLATMGGLWQVFAYGYMGLRPDGDRLAMDPRLPPSWSALDVRVRFHGRRLRLVKERSTFTVTADSPVGVSLDGRPYTAGPRGLVLRRSRNTWEVQS